MLLFVIVFVYSLYLFIVRLRIHQFRYIILRFCCVLYMVSCFSIIIVMLCYSSSYYFSYYLCYLCFFLVVLCVFVLLIFVCFIMFIVLIVIILFYNYSYDSYSCVSVRCAS